MFFEIDFRCATLKKVWHIYATQAFDYKPFGDLQEAGEENRIGYFGEQRDKESDYFAMGFRLYDPEIGRFLAIDPLLDIQPSQTPYHYCFNNPTSFTDPTGLYPEKEKDRVQAMEIEIPDDNFLRSELGYWSKWHEMCAIAFEIFVSQCEINWEINGYNGYGGGAVDIRLGDGEGCFTYYNPRNGIALPVNFMFNPGQDPYKVINNLVRSLNWQCADEKTSRDLAKYGSDGNSINVDVTMSGYKLGSLLKKHCVYNKDYANGISSNDWKGLKNIVDGVVVPDCYVPEFVEGWIYIASEFLNDGINKPAGVINLNSFNILGWEFGSYSAPFTFNIAFSHEMGHTLDSFFSPGNIDREESAHKRTKRQWDKNESGWYSIP